MTCDESARGLMRSASDSAERRQDGRAGLPHVGLRGAVDLEHAVEALDDLHARAHEVALTAMSVTRLISMPGEISTMSDASPAMGKKPFTSSRGTPRAGAGASRGTRSCADRPCALLAPSRPPPWRTPEPAALPLPAPRASWTIFTPTEAPMRVAPAQDHLLRVGGGRDAARGLDAELVVDRLGHQRDVVRRGAALGEARGGLDEVGAGAAWRRRTRRLLLVGEERGLEDHLEQRAGPRAPPRRRCGCRRRRAMSPDLSAPTLMTMSSLSRAVADGAAAFERLDLGRGRPEREADDRAHDARATRGAAAAQRLTCTGLRTPRRSRSSSASSQSVSMSAYVASGRSSVWSMSFAMSSGTSLDAGGADSRTSRAPPRNERTVSERLETQWPQPTHWPPAQRRRPCAPSGASSDGFVARTCVIASGRGRLD